jgi:tetratricopeptide (TPR) repeat protein
VTCLRLVLTALVLMPAAASDALATQRGEVSPTAQATPAGWRETTRSTLEMTLAGKHDEVIAIYEKWVANHPAFGDAQAMLAGAYEAKARDVLVKRVPDAGVVALNLFEKAAIHARRAFELGGPDPRSAIRALIDIYGPIGLNRPEEQERVIRDAIRRYPAEPLAHSEFIALLIAKGDNIDRALAAARATLPTAAKTRLEYADLLLVQAQRAREPYRTALLAEVERITSAAQQPRKRPR